MRRDDYEDLATASLFKALLELEHDKVDVTFENVSRKIEGDEFASKLLPMLMISDSLHASNQHYVPAECVLTFRLMKLEQRIEDLRRELTIAEREGDSEKVMSLSVKQIELSSQRQIMLRPHGDSIEANG